MYINNIYIYIIYRYKMLSTMSVSISCDEPDIDK